MLPYAPLDDRGGGWCEPWTTFLASLGVVEFRLLSGDLQNLQNRAPKCAKCSQKHRKMTQKLRNRLPKSLRRRLFTKPADLHKTCTGIVRLHVHPPWRVLFSCLLHQKVIQKTVLKASQTKIKKQCKKMTKKVPKRCPGTPLMLPRGTKNRSKFPLGSARAARRYPERPHGTPPDEKGRIESLFHQKSWKS